MLPPEALRVGGPGAGDLDKADLVQDTLAARSRHREAKLFDPTNSTGLRSAAWSPIAASTSWSAAHRRRHPADPREERLRRVA